MRRRTTIAILGLAPMLLLVGVMAGPASAATPTKPADHTEVDIVKVTGLIDPLNVDLVNRSLLSAEHDHALALVIQLSSTGAVVSQKAIAGLAARIHDDPVPVAIWVG